MTPLHSIYLFTYMFTYLLVYLFIYLLIFLLNVFEKITFAQNMHIVFQQKNYHHH